MVRSQNMGLWICCIKKVTGWSTVVIVDIWSINPEDPALTKRTSPKRWMRWSSSCTRGWAFSRPCLFAMERSGTKVWRSLCWQWRLMVPLYLSCLTCWLAVWTCILWESQNATHRLRLSTCSLCTSASWSTGSGQSFQASCSSTACEQKWHLPRRRSLERCNYDGFQRSSRASEDEDYHHHQSISTITWKLPFVFAIWITPHHRITQFRYLVQMYYTTILIT